MKATIIIPNINGKGWLKDSIESVYAQTEQNFQLIVVDNGSTDESLEQAIQVLAGLTEGDRLVGIISHVAALKDRIDHQVLVKKARSGGSTVELIV
jgi:glycosyltransferase involved in cell wall biosynthesis